MLLGRDEPLLAGRAPPSGVGAARFENTTPVFAVPFREKTTPLVFAVRFQDDDANAAKIVENGPPDAGQ